MKESTIIDPLFQPITINRMEVKNRIFMPAMYLNMAGKYTATARVVEITADCVRIECDGTVEEIPADTVVLAVGTKAYNPLQQSVAAHGIPFRVVGDALTPATVYDAIHQGFNAGRRR